MFSRIAALAALGVISVLALVSSSSAGSASIQRAVFSIRPNGTDRTLLLRLDPSTRLYRRSRDGQKIAFGSSPETDLYVTDLSGQNPVRIHPPGYPTFSPDSTRLAVSSADGLWVVAADDSERRLLDPGGGSPSWSPDGDRLVYSAPGSAPRAINVVNAGGGPVTTIARGYSPVWSPRGDRIAYVRTLRGYAVPCFIDPDGSHRRCYRGFSVTGKILWAPDGKRVVFRQSSSRLAVATPDGRHIRRFPKLKWRPTVAAWSPDGHRLAYVKEAFRHTQIYIRPVDKPGRERRVTNEPYPAFDEVRWRDGRITYIGIESAS